MDPSIPSSRQVESTLTEGAPLSEGIALADAGQHEAPRLKFQQASALTNSPTLLYNLARAEQRTGHYVDGPAHFRLFPSLDTNDPKIMNSIRENAKAHVIHLLTKAGQLEVEVPKEASLSIDGKPLRELPREPIVLSLGKHLVEASLGGASQTRRCARQGKQTRPHQI